MDNDDRPFVVVKFLSTDNDEDEHYEIAPSKWLQDLDENMIGTILWPGDNSTTGTLVRTQVNAQSNWSIYAVEIIKYCDTYFHARKSLVRIIEYASAYETNSGREMERENRKKKIKRIISSDESDNDHHLESRFKKKKSNTPSPPASHVPEAPTSDKISNHKYKRHLSEDSSNIKESKVARHLDELRVPLLKVKTPSVINRGEVSESDKHISKYECGKALNHSHNSPDEPILSENNRKKLLEKIISEREKTMKKAEEKKNTTLLSIPSSVLQSPQKQSKLSTSFSEHYVKSPCTSRIVKSPKKTISNNLAELYSAKEKTREKVKNSKSYASENQFTSEEETTILSPSISPLPQSPEEVTSLSVQEERNLLSSKEKLEPPIRNLSNFFSADFHERFIRLEKKLEDISSKLDIVIMNQTNRRLLLEQPVITRPSNLPPLPLNDLKSLEEFEKFLSTDVNLSAACYYLKSLTLGYNEKTATSKLMTQLMTNSLAVHFNFEGHNLQKAMKIKRSFKQLKLWELFQGVMLLKFPNSDLSEALNALRNWLRNAAWRKQEVKM